MYSVLDVAQYVIMRCNRREKTISNLKLQKMLYFIQANFLVSFNKPCFSEEIQAWNFGPVVPVVYHRYKIYGSASIPYVKTEEHCPFDENDKIAADEVIEEFSNYSAASLVEITHQQSPWIDAFRKRRGYPITIDSMKEFFLEG